MGARGPKPDPNQAAKGFPGRRRGKAEKAAAEAARLAELLTPSTSPAVADLPMRLRAPIYAAAAAVWRKLAPELKRTFRLPVETEDVFAMLCIYVQEWTDTTDDLHTRGFTQEIETLAGGKMERRRPSTIDRNLAFDNILKLSAKFGLTPVDMYDLFKGQALAASNNPGLFGGRGAAAEQPELDPAAETPPTMSRVGSMAAARTPPPAPRVN